MKTKIILHRCFWAMLIILLTACNLRAYYAPTPTALTIRATETPTPTKTSPQSVRLDSLRLAYIVDGNLYTQTSSGQPIQLTYSGQDYNPKFSDDGQKIVFFRTTERQKHTLYAINVDGSQEIALVTGNSLIALGLGYDEASEIGDFAFVPDKHQILFNTHQFKPANNEMPVIDTVNQDVLLADIDSAHIQWLVKPKQGKVLLWPNKSFHMSPNGKLIAVQTQDHIDVIGINGEQIHENVVPYLPNWIKEWILVDWSFDSSQLIVLPPILGNTDPIDGPDLRTVQQYPLDGAPMREIQLNPAPMADYFALSPNRSWIVYSYWYYAGKTDKTIPDGVYLGNLQDGSSHKLDLGNASLRPFSFEWSPDNNHFILYSDYYAEINLGNIDGKITPLPSGRFIGWLDENHYLFYTNGIVRMIEISQGMSVDVVDLPEPLMNKQIVYLTYVYPKSVQK